MTSEKRSELQALLPEGMVKFDEKLALHSALGVGGAIEAFAKVSNVDELKAVLAWATERDVEYLTWHRGSYTLVRDKGARGIAVKLDDSFAAISCDRISGDEVYVSVGAAARLDDLSAWALSQSFEGAEKLAKLGCTVGESFSSNAEKIFDLIEEATIVTRDGKELTMRRAAFRVENGAIKIPSTSVVIKALLKLKKVEGGAQVSTGEISIRGEEPNFTHDIFMDHGKIKASELIEEAGLLGVRVGGARISPDDPNGILNEGRATSRDLIVLMNLIRDKVKLQSGIALESRMKVIGDK